MLIKKKYAFLRSFNSLSFFPTSFLLPRESERERKWEVVRDTTLRGARNNISGFEGSQAVPACPSGISNAYYRKGCISKIGAKVRRAILGRNFDVTIGKASCEASSAT
jgi:hypothetical protein